MFSLFSDWHPQIWRSHAPWVSPGEPNSQQFHQSHHPSLTAADSVRSPTLGNIATAMAFLCFETLHELNARQCNATQRNIMQRNTTQRNATQRNAMQQRNVKQRNATQQPLFCASPLHDQDTLPRCRTTRHSLCLTASRCWYVASSSYKLHNATLPQLKSSYQRYVLGFCVFLPLHTESLDHGCHICQSGQTISPSYHYYLADLFT